MARPAPRARHARSTMPRASASPAAAATKIVSAVIASTLPARASIDDGSTATRRRACAARYSPPTYRARQPRPPHVAGGPVELERDMAELARVSAVAPGEPAVDDQPGADAASRWRAPRRRRCHGRGRSATRRARARWRRCRRAWAGRSSPRGARRWCRAGPPRVARRGRAGLRGRCRRARARRRRPPPRAGRARPPGVRSVATIPRRPSMAAREPSLVGTWTVDRMAPSAVTSPPEMVVQPTSTPISTPGIAVISFAPALLRATSGPVARVVFTRTCRYARNVGLQGCGDALGDRERFRALGPASRRCSRATRGQGGSYAGGIAARSWRSPAVVRTPWKRWSSFRCSLGLCWRLPALA